MDPARLVRQLGDTDAALPGTAVEEVDDVTAAAIMGALSRPGTSGVTLSPDHSVVTSVPAAAVAQNADKAAIRSWLPSNAQPTLAVLQAIGRLVAQ